MTGRTRIGIIAAIVVLGILGYGYLSDSSATLLADEQSKKGNNEESQEEPKKFEAPDFTLKNIDGEEVSLSDYKGKIVFINFWATWCPPCREEVPAFVELQEEFGKDTLVILGISLDQGDLSVVPKFAKDYNINYEVLYGDANVVRKYGGITGIPTTFIVDRDGYIRDGKQGFPGKDYFTQAIKYLM
jgi:cytochrome c biogenesis protein CcmG/thiol:disulfide interchange protein DsbE